MKPLQIWGEIGHIDCKALRQRCVNKSIHVPEFGTVMHCHLTTSDSHQPCLLALLKKVFPFLVKLLQFSETVPVQKRFM